MMRSVLPGVLGVLLLGCAGYLALCALLYLAQDRSIFYPGPNDPKLLQEFEPNRVEIRVADGTLEGWWIDNPQATTPAVIVYFGGNAEDVLYTATMAAKLNARRLLVVNYRGYGHSSGKPGQQAFYDDALAIYEYAVGTGVAPEHIVAMGRSLGSGVAAMLAGSRAIGAAIFITPFGSLSDVAANHYPFIPVRYLLRHPFPSTD